MPLYTVISTRTITESTRSGLRPVAQAREGIEHAPRSPEDVGDPRLRPTLLDPGLRTVESTTLVREDTRA